MAIDITAEKIIPIKNVPDWCHEKMGQRFHLSTVHRWRLKGTRGIRLESLLCGGIRVTSEEAILRFFDATTLAADG